jgi:hypothetical protein
MFRAYLAEALCFPVKDEASAAQCVRDICGVASRADLSRPGRIEERAIWRDLDREFQAWKVLENA